MTFTYDLALSSTKDKVRLLIGDTDSSEPYLQDEEIDFFLSQNSDAVERSALDACEAIIARLSRQVDSSIESISVSASQRVAQFTRLAQRLKKKIQNGNNQLGAVVSGVSISEMNSVEGNSDRPESAFRLNQFDNNDSTATENEF
jgi:hypothetical protein